MGRIGYAVGMSTQLAIKFTDAEMDALDELVEGEVGPTRSAVLHLALARLADDERRRRRRDADLAGYAEWPDTGVDDGADWSDLARRQRPR